MNIKISLLLLLVSAFYGCAKDELAADSTCELCDIYLYGEYTNYNGENPTFTVDRGKTSEFITYGNSSAEVVGDRVEIKIADLNIKQDNKRFNIDKYSIEEYKGSKWALQEEFSTANSSTTNKLAVVMVLDMSSSLGTDVNVVKSSANQFINNFLAPSNNKGQLGLVLFSEEVKTFPFTQSANIVSSNMYAYTTYINATTLYGAMAAGNHMLDTFSSNVGKKILVTFSDGGDNNTNDPSVVKQSILSSPHERYMIGLRGKGGDYLESDLIALATTPQHFIAAENIGMVSGAFDEIYNQISSTYEIRYFRTGQKFNKSHDAPVQVRIKITVKN